MEVIFRFGIRFYRNCGRGSRGSGLGCVDFGKFGSLHFFFAPSSSASSPSSPSYVGNQVYFNNVLIGHLGRKENEEACDGSEDQAMAYDR